MQAYAIWRFWGAAAIAALLAACGGGNSDDGSSDGPADKVRLECTVVDASTGDPVADATVTYEAGTIEYRTQTNAVGECLLDMPASVATGVKYPAATVSKAGYEPQTIICQEFQVGKTCNQRVSLIPLADNISIPVGGDTVWHLGDDQFSGTVNSQFQKATDGIALAFPIPDWADKVLMPGVTTATVYLDAKGWQSDICDNRIELAGDTGTASLPGGVSPPGGYWAGGRQVPFKFAIDQVGKLQAELRLSSGLCQGTLDRDDFETNRIRIEFD